MARRFGKVERLPSGHFRASITKDGRRHYAPITFDKEGDAETWIATARTDIVRGTWRATKVTGPTLRDYSLAWLARRKDLRPKSAVSYSTLLDLHILPGLGDYQLPKLTAATIRDWASSLAAGAVTRACAASLLRQILNEAVRDELITTNPCQVRIPKPAPQGRPVPSLAQVQAIAQAMPERYRAMVLVAGYGGLRFGELIALTREDIQIGEPGEPPRVVVSKQLVRVGGRWVEGDPKSAAGHRVIALPGSLRPVLEQHLRDFVQEAPRARVFATRNGTPLYRQVWGAMFKAAADPLGLAGAHPHDLRHAAATEAARAGATTKDLMARIGHASPRAALIYQHSAASRDELIARALDEAMSAAAAGNVVPLRKRAVG